MNPGHFDFEGIQKALHECVDEMYGLEKGVFVMRPDEIIARCGDSYITRRQIKHVLEQRKADGKSIEEVKEILDHLPKTIMQADFQVSNQSLKYPESIIRVKVFKKHKRGMIVVLDKQTENGRGLITAYPCHPTYAYFFQLKRLNTSTAGETPRS